MEKMIGKVINRRKALKTIAGLFGERFLGCLSAEESSNKYSGSDLLEAGQEISNIARDFITTRTLTPKNMTKMVIHIGQEHQHTSLPLEHTTRPMVERVVAIQKNIANILDTTMKFRGSPLFFELYWGGYSRECLEKNLEKASFWDGYLGISREDWLLFFSGVIPSLYQRKMNFFPAESEREYAEGIDVYERSLSLDGEFYAWTPAMKKEICTDREEYALQQILLRRDQLPRIIFGNGHDFSQVIQDYNKSHPGATLGYRKLSPRICYQS